MTPGELGMGLFDTATKRPVRRGCSDGPSLAVALARTGAQKVSSVSIESCIDTIELNGLTINVAACRPDTKQKHLGNAGQFVETRGSNNVPSKA